ncbi:hypothetical protein C8R46DRAFT_1215325 [Mycena filopes]|nr:hypothetical protein C8R46DRAFT_1215325 [Mycena filopes]
MGLREAQDVPHEPRIVVYIHPRVLVVSAGQGSPTPSSRAKFVVKRIVKRDGAARELQAGLAARRLPEYISATSSRREKHHVVRTLTLQALAMGVLGASTTWRVSVTPASVPPLLPAICCILARHVVIHKRNVLLHRHARELPANELSAASTLPSSRRFPFLCSPRPSAYRASSSSKDDGLPLLRLVHRVEPLLQIRLPFLALRIASSSSSEWSPLRERPNLRLHLFDLGGFLRSM